MSVTTQNVDQRIQPERAEGASVASKAADAAHDAVDKVAGRATDMEKVIRSATEDSAEAIEEKVQDAKAGLDSISREIQQYVNEKPMASAGMAFGAGVLLSLLLRK